MGEWDGDGEDSTHHHYGGHCGLCYSFCQHRGARMLSVAYSTQEQGISLTCIEMQQLTIDMTKVIPLSQS